MSFRRATVGLSILVMTGFACSSDAPGTADGQEPFVFPLKAHSGFDGTHTFKVPFIANIEPDPVWELADPSLGTIEPIGTLEEWEATPGSWVLITTTGTGMTELTATLGEFRASTTLTITAYAPSDLTTGETRYRTPVDPGSTRVACASCHEAEGGADHSPVRAAMYDDAELLSIIMTGELPGQVMLRAPHQWDIRPDEQRGIVAYLRSLPPRGF